MSAGGRRRDYPEAVLKEEHYPGEIDMDSWWRRWIKLVLGEAREAGVVDYNCGRHAYQGTGAGEPIDGGE